MRSTVKAAKDFTKRTSLSKAFLAGLAVFALTACGGGDGDGGGLCASPQITSAPPTYATVNQQYRYITESAYQCFSFLNPYACSGVQGVQLPAGAYASGNLVSWTPAPNFGGTAVQFKIATPPDACDHRATQTWTVNVENYTPPQDTTPPFVALVSPTDLATNVPINSKISATFNEPIDPNSIDSTSFIVVGPAGSVPGSISVSSQDATFTPNGDLAFSSTFTTTLTAAIKDASGNALTSSYTWSFTTGVGPDVTPPTVPTLGVTHVGGSKVEISWDNSSIDDVAVYGYIVRSDAGFYKSVVAYTTLSFVVWDTQLTFNTSYCYTISAIDGSGNESAQSNPLCVTTLDFLPGTVANWGNGGGGSNSIGTNIPDVVANLGSVSAISQMPHAGLAVKSDGTVWKFESAQLPTQVPNISNVIAVAGGDHHFLAVKSDGTVWAWGQNRYGEANVLNLSQVVSVAAGFGHSLALKSDGTVWAVGYNNRGQLGDGTTTNQAAETQVLGLSNMIAIAASWYGSLALKADGTVWSWGDAYYGSAFLAYQVAGISNVVAIAQGDRFSLAVNADGTVWAWGLNNNGQLGDGTNVTYRAVPVQVTGLSGVIAVAAGVKHSVALKSDGTVWAWGSAGGNDVPVQVPRIEQARAIAANYLAAMALR